MLPTEITIHSKQIFAPIVNVCFKKTLHNAHVFVEANLHTVRTLEKHVVLLVLIL